MLKRRVAVVLVVFVVVLSGSIAPAPVSGGGWDEKT
jgi:hypothetical protein